MARKTHNYLQRVHQTERGSASHGGSSVRKGGSEICFGLGLRGKKRTVGKNRSDSERKRWECEWRILGNPTEIALFASLRRAKEFR